MLFNKETTFKNWYTPSSIIIENNYENGNIFNKEFSYFNLFKNLYPNTNELVVDIILYVTLVVNILTFLFFTVVKNVEKEIIQTQINNLLDSLLINEDTVNVNVLYEQQYKIAKQNLIAKINSVQIDQEEEDKIKKHNDEIFKNSMIFLLVINILCIFSLFVLWKYNKFDILYYLKKNFILGIFVILTEILFLYVISKNYMYIDKKYILKILQQKITK